MDDFPPDDPPRAAYRAECGCGDGQLAHHYVWEDEIRRCIPVERCRRCGEIPHRFSRVATTGGPEIQPEEVQS